MEENTMVPGEPNGKVAPATVPGEVVAPVAPTLTTTPEDAEKAALAAQQAELLQAQVAKQAEDLNRMKSTFQRNEALREKDWAERERNYLQQIESSKLSGMDEDQRKAYEASSSARRVQEL